MLTAFPALVSSAIAAVYLTPPNEMPHETRAHQSVLLVLRDTNTCAAQMTIRLSWTGRMSWTHMVREQQLHQHDCAFAPLSAPHPLRSLRALVTFSNLQNILERRGRKRFQAADAYGGDRREPSVGVTECPEDTASQKRSFLSQDVHSSLLAGPAMCSNETQLLCSHVARNCYSQ